VYLTHQFISNWELGRGSLKNTASYGVQITHSNPKAIYNHIFWYFTFLARKQDENGDKDDIFNMYMECLEDIWAKFGT